MKKLMLLIGTGALVGVLGAGTTVFVFGDILGRKMQVAGWHLRNASQPVRDDGTISLVAAEQLEAMADVRCGNLRESYDAAISELGRVQTTRVRR